MKITEINKENDWNDPLWTDAMKEALKKGNQNHTVGMTLLTEDEKVKVWGINLPAHQSLPFHNHNKPYFYVCKSKGKSRSYYSNGKIVESEYEVDDIKYFNDLSDENNFIHNLENIGETELLFTTVELKF